MLSNYKPPNLFFFILQCSNFWILSNDFNYTISFNDKISCDIIAPFVLQVYNISR